MAALSIRLGPHLKELRIHLCQKSPASQGVRDFIENHYLTVKKSNPKFPILIRECSGVTPKLWARFDLGREMSVPLDNLKSDEVLNTIKKIADMQRP